MREPSQGARHRFLLGALPAGLAGCALLLGIEEKPVTPVVDAGPDPCAHVAAPLASGAEDDADPGHQRRFIVAARGVDLQPATGGALGFDLDGTCTCFDAGSAATARDGGGSCRSASVTSACDADGGVDDALGGIALLRAAFSASSGNDSLTEGIACGRTTLLEVIGDYNGRANDADVTIAIVLSPGVQTPHDAGEAPSACNNAIDGGFATPVVYAPRWDGTDLWSSDTNFVARGSLQPLDLLHGFVRDGVLVARADPDAVIKIPLATIVADGRQVVVVARLERLDAAGAVIAGDAPADRVRVVDGQVAARLTARSLLGAVPKVSLGKIGYLCPGDRLFDEFVGSICTARDVVSDPAQDFAGTDCDAVSGALRFTAEPAQMDKPNPPFDGGASPCADVAPTCDGGG